MPPEIKNSPDDCQVVFKPVAHGIWEPFGQEAVVSKELRMDTRVKRKGVNVGKQGVKKKYSPTPSAGIS